MKMISFKKELVCIGTLDEILKLINNDERNIFSVDIKEYDTTIQSFKDTEDTQYKVEIIYKKKWL